MSVIPKNTGAILNPNVEDFWKHLKDAEAQRANFEGQIIELLANMTRERPHTRFDLSASAVQVTHLRIRLDTLILTNKHSAVQAFVLSVGGRSDFDVQLAANSSQSFALPGIILDRGISVQIVGSVNQTFSAYLFGIIEQDVFEPPFRQSFP